MNIFVTGGAGFVGSHIARFYANKGHSVRIYDNMSRYRIFGKRGKMEYNWRDLIKYGVRRTKGDITDFKRLRSAMEGRDTVFHMAGQTGVTSSMKSPKQDFNINALGTLNVLEAARKEDVGSIIYASTNKVYGNQIKAPKMGVPENYPIDHCEHSPYGCSKLTGDIYTQDYGHLYGIKTGVFRMSCIYGTHQFGLEGQGWVSWFVTRTLLGKPLTIYGDGTQTRDVLWVEDLVKAYHKFVRSKHKQKVYNIGGGKWNTTTLNNLLTLLETITGKRSKITYKEARPADQHTYISDIQKVCGELNWQPKVRFEEGVSKMTDWTSKNLHLFK